MKWFYFDEIGYKIGPISSAELKELAASGIVTPSTLIETETGKSSTAGCGKPSSH